MSEPQWRPQKTDVEESNVFRFMAYVDQHQGTSLRSYPALYQWSIAQPEKFWSSVWDFCGVIAQQVGNEVLANASAMPGARWFPEAKLNFAENLLRRRDRAVAIVFRGEDQVACSLTYAELYEKVSRMAQAMRAAGVTEGDRVASYLPNLPETVIAMLATTSLGALWSSCSPDFGVEGVVDRFGQIEPKLLVMADGYFYSGKTISSLSNLAGILDAIPSIERVVVVSYVGDQAGLGEHQHDGLRPNRLGASGLGKVSSWDDFIAPFHGREIEFASLPFDHPVYIMYSSGTTGPPKCIVHGAGGTLLQHLKEHVLHADVRRGDRVFYFTTCGWMMWNWLVSALAAEATLVLFDGAPFYPDARTLFDYADAVEINVFGTSAKYIDAVKKSGLKPRQTHNLSSIRAILSTGSPLVEESFDFVYADVKPNVRLSSITGGTDILGCFAQGTAILPVWRGELQCRALGMKVEVFNDAGQPIKGGKGELVCSAPFPSMPVGFWRDPDGAKYHAAYFDRFDNVWCHGDYVELTVHDGLVVHGRSDAVLNPGGVRIGTAEIYRQVEQLDEVVEGLVIGQDWEDDTRVVLFVCLRAGLSLDVMLEEKIRRQIRTHTTPRHVPARILQVPDIPRTKSGKIVELAVREVVHERPVKNIEALANPEALTYFEGREELRV